MGDAISIVLIIVILGFVGFLIFGCFLIKEKIERFSLSIFGTKSLKQGWDNQADRLAETPKSISSMTRLIEPQIAKDFPEFNWLEFRDKVESMLVSSLTAISTNNLSSLGDVSDSIEEQIRIQIEKNQADGIKERYERVKVHQTELSKYEKKAGKCVITLQSAIEYLYYKEQNGKLLDGDKNRLTQTKYNTEMMYIQDVSKMNASQSVGMTCPNCGAPITSLGERTCEYCGAGIIPINIQVWALQNFYEITYNRS